MSNKSSFFSWFSNKKKQISAAQESPASLREADPSMLQSKKGGGWLERLERAASTLTEKISSFFHKPIDEEMLRQLEEQLLLADVGRVMTQRFMSSLRKEQQQATEPTTGKDLHQWLSGHMTTYLTPFATPILLESTVRPFALLLVGVNGSGKTTLLAKLAAFYQRAGKKILLAAGDTFRAAATEQLDIWSKRLQLPISKAQYDGQDPASLLFDALTQAKRDQYDLLLADTAGRLQSQNGLMRELQKITKVMKKIEAKAPHEILLVIDATLGQNSLIQAKQFLEYIPITGLAITKLDGTAKGGAIFGITEELQLPIRFVGTGEGLPDLMPFSARGFVSALLQTKEIH